jgi:CRP/FNR family cyclic AMP-dependent transcriptional regulator
MTDKKKNGQINAFWGNIFTRIQSKSHITNVEVLQLCPLFQHLTNREMKKVSGLIYERRYQAGEYLFEKDQPGTAMFIIKSGLVNIVVPGRDGEETVMAALNTEEFLGELALLDDTPRSASAKAVEKTETLAFFREDLHELQATYPAIAGKIFRDLAIMIGRRLKAANEQLYTRGE